MFLILFIVVSLGTSVELNCALRNPDGSRAWWKKRDSHNIFRQFSLGTTKYGGLYTKTLTIHNLVYDDTGIYRCEGYVNGLYKKGQQIEITVTGKLGQFVNKIQDFHRCHINII
jgi:hypothetical protein